MTKSNPTKTCKVTVRLIAESGTVKPHLVSNNTAPSDTETLSPTTVKRTVKTDTTGRVLDYLTPKEVDSLIIAAKTRRYGLRNSLMISIAYHHGLRAKEVVSLTWRQINFEQAEISVNRVKGSKSTTQPIQGPDLRLLRRLYRERKNDEYVFTSERGGPLSTAGYRRTVERAGVAAGLPFHVHSHMLRHACGYYLANKGVDIRTMQDYLGHRNIQNTVRYTDVAAARFKGLWD